MPSLSRLLAAVAFAVLLFSGRIAHAEDLLAVLQKTPELSTLAKLVEAAGLNEDLKTAPVLTLLAPTNDAFAKLPKEQTAELLKPENKAKLRSILLYHAIAAKFTAVDVRDLPVGSKGPSVAGPALTLTNFDPPTINGVAKIVKTDLMADNGVIHEIDAVLLPPTPQKKSAPVTMPKSAGEALTGAATETLAATVAKVPELSTFARLVKETGLGDSLAKRGPLTVFAPTNAAFEKMFAGVDVEEVIRKQRKAGNLDTLLLPILYRHVMAGSYAAADLSGMDGQSLRSLPPGASLKIAAKDGKITINGVPVVRPDLAAKNGILHIVDGILPQ